MGQYGSSMNVLSTNILKPIEVSLPSHKHKMERVKLFSSLSRTYKMKYSIIIISKFYLINTKLTVEQINEEMAKAEERLGTEDNLHEVDIYVLQSNIHEYRQLLIDKANGLF